MPACVLRVAGSKRKIRKFLSTSFFEPDCVYYRGEPGFVKSRGPTKISSFNYTVSGSHGSSILKQAKDVIWNLERYRQEFERLKSFKFKYMTLDFGLDDLATEEHPWPTYRLPKKLVSLAGEFGFEIELSFYGPPPPQKAANQENAPA